MPATIQRWGEAVAAITYVRIQTFAIREESDAAVQTAVMPAQTRSNRQTVDVTKGTRNQSDAVFMGGDEIIRRGHANTISKLETGMGGTRARPPGW